MTVQRQLFVMPCLHERLERCAVERLAVLSRHRAGHVDLLFPLWDLVSLVRRCGGEASSKIYKVFVWRGTGRRLMKRSEAIGTRQARQLAHAPEFLLYVRGGEEFAEDGCNI